MNHKAKDVADEWNLSSVTIVCRDDDENLSRLTDATMAPSNGDLRLKDGGVNFERSPVIHQPRQGRCWSSEADVDDALRVRTC
ncbi:hypothetical protein OUZ56_005117 [Daphnia magna]|uniref:Uncharacterized protein n=1 Tax=Daphnia magna TaxID=35525 RepID=A0ABQ9YRV4_9CRUS|nr:hypothetical protein OUZ56_005117 [Daphnia magna]